MTRKTPPFTTVIANLGRLNCRELEEIAAMVAGLLEVLDDEDAAATPGPKNGRAGYIEYKTINGCGPYAYLCFYSGKDAQINLHRQGRGAAISGAVQTIERRRIAGRGLGATMTPRSLMLAPKGTTERYSTFTHRA